MIGEVPKTKQLELTDDEVTMVSSTLDVGKKWARIGGLVTRIVARSHDAYGDSLSFSASAMRVLYPQGIPQEEYEKAGILLRILDKIGRLSAQPTAFGESPFIDIAGYAIRGALLDEERLHGGRE